MHDTSGFLLKLVQDKKLRGPERLAYVAEQVLDTILPWGPKLVAIEGYSMCSSGRWFDLGEIGGLLKVELYRKHIPFIVVPPSVLKCFVANNGLAKKETIMRCMEDIYGIKTKNDDLADAAGLARLAYVYLTGDSRRRCELEAVHALREMPMSHIGK